MPEKELTIEEIGSRIKALYLLEMRRDLERWLNMPLFSGPRRGEQWSSATLTDEEVTVCWRAVFE